MKSESLDELGKFSLKLQILQRNQITSILNQFWYTVIFLDQNHGYKLYQVQQIFNRSEVQNKSDP